MKNKRFLFAISLFLIVSACKNNTTKPSDKKETEKTEAAPKTEKPSFLISESRAGNFEIGDSIPATTKNFQIRKAKKTRYAESGPVEEPIFILSKNNLETLLFKPEYDRQQSVFTQKIGEITVVSRNYKTKEGIGVGSSLKKFMEVYPNYKIWYTYVSDRYVLENSKTSLQFLLSETDFEGKTTPKNVKTPLKVSDFNEGAKIGKVRIYR